MISIAAVAKLAHVSPATAARVINNNGYVSQEKQEAVMRAIEELGYIPNLMAGNLRRKRSNFIGYMLPVLSENPFFTRFGNAFDQAAQEAGYQVLTAITHEDPDREKQLVTSLVGMMVEAIVFLGSMLGSDTIQWVLSQGVPVVMIEQPGKVYGADSIAIDNYQAVQISLNHVISRGHRKIGFIGRAYRDSIVEQRYRGFVDGMREHGLEPLARHVCTMPDYSVEYGRQAICRMLDAGDPPTAVVTTSDMLACGALQGLYERGLRVPDDISLVGFDNTVSALSAPPLTSIELQPDLIGAAAVDMVIDRRQRERASSKTVIFSPVLVDRGSVKVLSPNGQQE